jgi:23S rRNA (uridine2552-2'-O)-methyltransferase
VDEANFLDLAEIVRELSIQLLVPGGSMVIKLFQFQGTDTYIGELKNWFSSITRRKPQSSRRTSREIYVVAKGFGI